MDNFGFDGPRRPLVWRILLAPFSLIGRFFERFASGDDLAGNRGFVGWLYLIFVAPFTWLFSTSFNLLLGWSSSRQTTSFFLGVPSFLFAIGIVSIYAYGTLTPKRLIDPYKNRLKMAEFAEEYEEAEVYLNKLMRLDQEDLNERRLEKVTLLEKQDKTSDAVLLLREMTNPDNPESVINAGAHLKLALYYLGKKFWDANQADDMSPSEKAQFLLNRAMQVKYHCEMALTSNPKPAEEFWAHKWLYQFFVQRKEYDQAEEHLQYIHQRDPYTYAIPHYAFYSKHVDRQSTADAAADRDAKLLLERLKANPGNADLWKQIALFNLARKDFEQASKHLAFAKPVSPEQAATLRALQALVLTQAAIEQKKVDPIGSRVSRLEKLSASLAIMPLREAIIEMVLLGFPVGPEADGDQWLYDAKANAQVGSPTYYGANLLLGLKASFDGKDELAKEYLDVAGSMSKGMPVVLKLLQSTTNDETLGDDGKPLNVDELAKTNGAPAVSGIYMILGGHAVSSKDFKRGREFFEKSLKLNPTSTAAMNNLAVCIANTEGASERELQEALLIVSDAVNQKPGVSNYYESRGSIYLKLNQPEDAIRDLEKALALGFRDQKVVWQNLAKACRAAGREEEAKAYERSLEAIGVKLDGSSDTADEAPETTTEDAEQVDASSENTGDVPANNESETAGTSKADEASQSEESDSSDGK